MGDRFIFGVNQDCDKHITLELALEEKKANYDDGD